jgi:uncharacterized protein
MPDPQFFAFTVEHWAAMLAIAAFAGFAHGFVGLGFPLLATPLLGLLFGFKAAVALLVLPTLVVSLCSTWAFRRELRLRSALSIYWPLPVLIPVGVWLGVWALFVLDAAVLMILMAAVMLTYLALDWLGHAGGPGLRSRPTALAVPFALAAGFAEGAINISGPTLLIYFLVLDLPVAAMIALLNWMFVLGKSVQAVLMYGRDAFGPATWQALLPLSVAGSMAYFTGLACRRRFDPSRYRGWLKATLALVAVGLVLRVVTGDAL